jgi:hypothetical protein
VRNPFILGVGLVLAILLLVLRVGVAARADVYPASCDNMIDPAQDLDAIVNADPVGTATTFCVSVGTHTVSDTAILRAGDHIMGPVGNQLSVGPATYGQPTAKLVGDTTPQVLRASGSDVTIEWLEVTGADGQTDALGEPVTGTGSGIAMGQADGTALVQYVYVHDNDANGIANANGRIKNSHFTSNTLNPAFLGWNGTGVIGVSEFEASYNYVHDEQGNGLYFTNSTSTEGNVPEMASNPNGGAWFRSNVSVNNGRWGLRYEVTPLDAADGEHISTPTFQAGNNRVAGNGNGGASQADAQNGKWISNTFGAQTIGGVSYPGNGNTRAIVFRDSGRTDRPDLWNAVAKNNVLNGDTMPHCDLPDEVVACSGNTP